MASVHMHRITMGDLAKLAGVSRPTVSRALRGDPRISAATIERIRKLAEEAGYERDPAFEVLSWHRKSEEAQHHRFTVGYLYREEIHAEAYLKGATNCAKELGYSVDRFTQQEYPGWKGLERVLLGRGIRGLLLPVFTSDEGLPPIDFKKFAAVCCSVDYQHPPIHVVRTNVVSKIEIAFSKCLEKGYRRIAVLLHHRGPTELDRLRAGAALYHLSVLPPEDRLPLWFEPYSGSDNIAGWLDAHRPDAVIAGDLLVLQLLKEYLRECGRNLPHCCLIQTENASHLSSRAEVIGYTAMSMLHQQIVENRRGYSEEPLVVVTEPSWVERGTF